MWVCALTFCLPALRHPTWPHTPFPKGAQERLRRLLALNEAGMLSAEEQAELDEIEQIEHIMTLLKAQTRGQLAGKADE